MLHFFHLENPEEPAKRQRGGSTFDIIKRMLLANYSRSYLFVIFIFFFYLSPFAACHSPDQNLIINGNFSQPLVLNRTQSFDRSILGWNCTWLCQIKNCKMGMKYWLPQGKIDSNCVGQVIDLNSNNFNEKVTQGLQLKEGNYLLHFNYYYPVQRAGAKGMQVTFNEQVLFDVRPQVSASFVVFKYSAVVRAVQGNNALTFANLGYSADGMGFKINNVSLYRQIDHTFQETVNTCMVHGSLGNKFPGARVALRNILSFLINFDRLQLYIYHNRTYSYNLQSFLLSVNIFLNTKSEMPKGFLQNLNDEVIKAEDSFIVSLNYKQGYVSYASFSEDYQNPNFFDNLNQSMIYFLPFVLLLFLTLNFFFRLLFHKRVSITIRKFQFWGIILIMTFDGNIENLTFHIFAEFKIFFSQCYRHKLLNVFILALFFLLIFTIFAFYLWAKYHYGKRFKHFLDDKRINSCVILGAIIDRGFVCFIFGTTHQMLISSPNLQFALLFFIELCWIIKKGIFISKKCYSQKWMVVTGILNGLCRIFFQVSVWMYASNKELRFQLNEKIHQYFIILALVSSLLELLVGFAYSLHSLCRITRKPQISQLKCLSAVKSVKEREIQQTVVKIKEVNKPIVEERPRQTIKYYQTTVTKESEMRFAKITLRRRINKNIIMKGNVRWTSRLRNEVHY